MSIQLSNRRFIVYIAYHLWQKFFAFFTDYFATAKVFWRIFARQYYESLNEGKDVEQQVFHHE